MIYTRLGNSKIVVQLFKPYPVLTFMLTAPVKPLIKQIFYIIYSSIDRFWPSVARHHSMKISDSYLEM